MKIDLSTLSFAFSRKPLLIGGKAMEYYGLRKAGQDIDFVVTKDDLAGLLKRYPTHLKNIWGDLGVTVNGFEIWKTVNYFNYDYLSQNAVEEDNYLVISLEKLLLQKALVMHKQKYHSDLELVVKKIADNQLLQFEDIKKENELISPSLASLPPDA